MKDTETGIGKSPFSYIRSHDTRPYDPEAEAWCEEGTTEAGKILSQDQLGVLERIVGRNGIRQPTRINADVSHRYDEFGCGEKNIFSASVRVTCIDERGESYLLINKRTTDREKYHRWKTPTGWIEEDD